MKKGIIVLLLVALVAGTAFAGFSGNANIQFTGDLEYKNFGISNNKPMSFTFTLDSEKVSIGEEEGIHAELEASVNVIIDRDKSGTGADTVWTKTLSNKDYMLGIVAKISTAKIVGDGWYVSILGVKSTSYGKKTTAYDYAKAAVQSSCNSSSDAFGNTYAYYTSTTMSYIVPYATASGVTVGYQGYTVSAGFDYLGTASSGNVGAKFSATAETKSFKFADDAVTVQAAASISKGYDNATTGEAGALNAGFNGKASFTMDKISASVAADLGLANLNTETDAGADVRVDAAYDFVSGSVYFAKDSKISYYDYDALGNLINPSYEGDYLEAKVDVDLNAFDVPVTVGITAQNITQSKLDGADQGMVFGVSADYAKDAITAGAGASLDLTDKSWDVNVYASYAAEKYTAGAGCYIANDGTEMSALSLGGFVESDAIVKNATIGAQYGLSTSYFFNYGGDYCTGNAYYSNNFLADEAGAMSLYCKIAF